MRSKLVTKKYLTRFHSDRKNCKNWPPINEDISIPIADELLSTRIEIKSVMLATTIDTNHKSEYIKTVYCSLEISITEFELNSPFIKLKPVATGSPNPHS